MVFTTKHHDGFKYVLIPNNPIIKSLHHGFPFHTNAKADVTKEIFSAFSLMKGFGIGAYFSKPDWHSEYFLVALFSAKGPQCEL